jgi:type IV pilus assembly protein PilP
MKFAFLPRAVGSSVIAAGLMACSGAEQQDLKQWMSEVRAQTKTSVPKLPEPKKFEPHGYAVQRELDPFNPQKLAVAQARLQARTGTGIRPDLDRRREALEAYPLDAISMVGVLRQNNQTFALLQADKTLYRVSAGNYVGQNFGKITGVTETEVALKEIVQDAAGEWTERPGKLQLQEVKK